MKESNIEEQIARADEIVAFVAGRSNWNQKDCEAKSIESGEWAPYSNPAPPAERSDAAFERSVFVSVFIRRIY